MTSGVASLLSSWTGTAWWSQRHGTLANIIHNSAEPWGLRTLLSFSRTIRGVRQMHPSRSLAASVKPLLIHHAPHTPNPNATSLQKIVALFLKGFLSSRELTYPLPMSKALLKIWDMLVPWRVALATVNAGIIRGKKSSQKIQLQRARTSETKNIDSSNVVVAHVQKILWEDYI